MKALISCNLPQKQSNWDHSFKPRKSNEYAFNSIFKNHQMFYLFCHLLTLQYRTHNHWQHSWRSEKGIRHSVSTLEDLLAKFDTIDLGNIYDSISWAIKQFRHKIKRDRINTANSAIDKGSYSVSLFSFVSLHSSIVVGNQIRPPPFGQ